MKSIKRKKLVTIVTPKAILQNNVKKKKDWKNKFKCFLQVVTKSKLNFL
jgi:hypothetical protein